MRAPNNETKKKRNKSESNERKRENGKSVCLLLLLDSVQLLPRLIDLVSGVVVLPLRLHDGRLKRLDLSCIYSQYGARGGEPYL